MLSDHPITPDEAKYYCNNSNNQENMNKPACRKNKKTKKPANYQDYSNNVKHNK